MTDTISITTPDGEPVPATDNVGRLAYYRRKGYVIEVPLVEEQAPAYPDGDPVEAWTVAQLTAWAGKNGADVPAGPKPAVVEAVLAVVAERKATAEADAKAAENTPPAE